jgi:hypothetical protein
MTFSHRPLILLALLLAPGFAGAELSALNLGLDYKLRGVGIQNNDGLPDTQDSRSYYSHQARIYMNGWLNNDVEAGLRIQSINIWGLEGSTSAPVTRYPAADGTPWIEQVYVHMPNLIGKHLDLTIGRQSIVIGDGMLVSDDQLGFNALRAKVFLPAGVGLDLFTAKVQESLNGQKDSDLNGAVVGFNQGDNKWELSWIQEENKSPSAYLLGGSTTTATRVSRTFYDLRLFGDLKDAYYKLEFAMGQGHSQTSAGDVKIQGIGEKIELGAQSDTARFGRFGVKALYASGSGDDPGTTDKDESFRPTFAQRWDGLQRKGWGQHFGGTLSDGYDPNFPFSPTATGLPNGASGIKTLGFGIFTVQRVNWTGNIDYYTFDSRVKVPGSNQKSIGAELDLGLAYRYTGYVTFGLGAATFFPGDVYGENVSKVTRYTAETEIHF